MKETEKKYLLAIVKSIQTIQDCLFEVARRLEELEKDNNNMMHSMDEALSVYVKEPIEKALEKKAKEKNTMVT